MTVAELLKKTDEIGLWEDRLFWWKGQAIVGGSLTVLFTLQSAIWFMSDRPVLAIVYLVSAVLEGIVWARAITNIHDVKQIVGMLKRLAGVKGEQNS